MGNDQRGETEAFLDAFQLRPHGDTQRGIEVRERFIEQKNVRLLHQRAGKSYALLLAAGKLRGATVEQSADLHKVCRLFHTPGHFFLAHGLEAQWKGDVFPHRKVRIERIGLENDADIAVTRIDAIDVMAIEGDLATARRIKTGEQEKRGRLAAAGRA
ncbi:hypothetical protein D3C80_962000 [compost metagenome]